MFQKQKQLGLTLLEMILFIVVLGVAGVALLATLAGPLSGAGTQTEAVRAAQAGQARMEVVLGQKRKGGYPENAGDPVACGSEIDPCASDSGLAFCDAAVPNGWTVDTRCEPWDTEDTNCYVVAVVTATSPEGSDHETRTLFTNLSVESCAS